MPEDPLQEDSAPLRSTHPNDELPEAKAWWHDRRQWLARHSYMLHPCYQPGWKPLWKAHPDKFPWHFEDWHVASVCF